MDGNTGLEQRVAPAQWAVSACGCARRAQAEPAAPQFAAHKSPVNGGGQGEGVAAARELVAADGPLISAVATAVEKRLGPLCEQIDRLARQIQTNEAVSEALENTTAKGTPYEERVLEECIV